MWRLIHEVQLGRSCDSLRAHLEAELQASRLTLQQADSVIAAERARVRLEVEGGKILRAQAATSKQQNDLLRDEVKKQKLLTIAVAVASVLAILIVL
jgi:plasmid replication initiation protein